MDFCDWRVGGENVAAYVNSKSWMLDVAKQIGIKIEFHNNAPKRLKLSWQKVFNENNVEENTLEANISVWQLIEYLFKDVTFKIYSSNESYREASLMEVITPYITEFSKNVIYTHTTHSEVLEWLQRIKTTNWNARFQRGDDTYFVDENAPLKIKEDKNGTRVSLWTENIQLSIYAKNLQLASKRDKGSREALWKLGQKHLTVIRFEVRIKTLTKLNQIMKRVCKKETWDIYDLLNPDTEKMIVQHFFLPILHQVPIQVQENQITQYFEKGREAGFTIGDMEHAIGHLVMTKLYPEGAYRNIVINKGLPPKEKLKQSGAWQYNKTKMAKIMAKIPFNGDLDWTNQKEEMIKQLTEFKPFQFEFDTDLYDIDEEELQQLADKYFAEQNRQQEAQTTAFS